MDVSPPPLSVAEWEPHFRFFLLHAALEYPMHPNPSIKKQYYRLYTGLGAFFPDPRLYESYIASKPVEGRLDNKIDLLLWTNDLLNIMRRARYLPPLSLHDTVESYSLHKQSQAQFNILSAGCISIAVLLLFTTIASW